MEINIIEELIKAKSQNNILFEVIKQNEPLNCIDIGCGYPINLSNLYHLYNCSNLIGNDIKSENECVKYFKTHNKNFYSYEVNENLKKAKTFFDIYTATHVEEEGEIPKLTSIDEYEKIFLSGYKIGDIREIEIDIMPFDIIICSNVLHFENDEEKRLMFLNKIKDLVSKNGLIFIRVENRPTFDYNNFKIQFKSLFPNCEIFEVVENGQIESSVMINRKDIIIKS